MDDLPECLRNAAEVQTATNSLTESSQSLRVGGFQMTEWGNGEFSLDLGIGGTVVGALGVSSGGRGSAMVDDAIIGGGGSLRARGGHTLTSFQNDNFGRSTDGTDSISYRTLTGVLGNARCFGSRVDRRLAIDGPPSSSSTTNGGEEVLSFGALFSACELPSEASSV